MGSPDSLGLTFVTPLGSSCFADAGQHFDRFHLRSEASFNRSFGGPGAVIVTLLVTGSTDRQCVRLFASIELQMVAITVKYVNMADINSPAHILASDLWPPASAQDGRNHVSSDLVTMVELLFFAYRDFTSEPDLVLAELGFGRAHHRVLHFVNRHPGLRVAELLDVLRITKQSLARVLKQLVDEGYVRQVRPKTDRRERRLQVTVKGQRLADRLLSLQAERLGQALSLAGPDAGKIAERFLAAVVSPCNREQVARLVAGETGLTTASNGGA